MARTTTKLTLFILGITLALLLGFIWGDDVTTGGGVFDPGTNDDCVLDPSAELPCVLVTP